MNKKNRLSPKKMGGKRKYIGLERLRKKRRKTF